MRQSLFAAFTAALLASAVPAAAQSSDRIPAEGGDVVITPILHSSVQIEHGGTVVHIDPWTAGDLSSAKPADLDPGDRRSGAITSIRRPSSSSASRARRSC